MNRQPITKRQMWEQVILNLLSAVVGGLTAALMGPGDKIFYFQLALAVISTANAINAVWRWKHYPKEEEPLSVDYNHSKEFKEAGGSIFFLVAVLGIAAYVVFAR